MRVAKPKGNPMAVLRAELALIGLPVAVVYALEAMGVTMAGSVVEGPLPVNKILLAASAATVVVVMAANWSTVEPKFGRIVTAFRKAFSKSSTTINKAFGSIRKDVETQVKKSSKPSVVVKGKTVTLKNIKYECTTKATSLSKGQRSSNKYYPALLYGNNIFVDSTHPLTAGAAQTILKLNNGRVGVLATKQSYARGICGGSNAIYHSAHGGEGYYRHYHHPNYKTSHCWFLD